MKNEKQNLLYILAPSYSGSTLLTYLLSQHAGIATIGELKATPMGDVDEYLCSCGTRIVECPFWLQVREECRAFGMEFDVHHFDTVFKSDENDFIRRLLRADVRGPLLESVRSFFLGAYPRAKSNLDARLARNDTLIRVITNLQQGVFFLDGSKDAARLLHFVESERFNVKVIHLSRDGRAVSASIAKHSKIPFFDAAKVWARNMRGIRNMRARLSDDQVIDLRYEDFCREPEQKLRDIFGWLGLDQSDVDTNNFRNQDNHILGNSMRLSGTSSIQFDEKWRSILSEDEIRAFDNRYGGINQSFGYGR